MMAVLLMVLAMPVQGRVLLVVGDPPAADVTDETTIITDMWGVYARALGVKYSVVMMDAYTMDGADTVWTCETMAASGNYTMAVMINLPEFDASYKTNSHCKDGGLNKFGRWIGPSDVAFPLPVVVLLEGEAYATASIFTDSTGVHSVAASCADTYNPIGNAFGDSLGLSTHCEASYPEAYLDIANQTHVTPLSWRSDSTLSSVYVPSNWWMYDKDNGYPVYIIQHAQSSMMAGAIITTLSMHEMITPVDIGLAVDKWAYPNTADSVGVAVNINNFLDYIIAEDLKVDLFVIEPYHDTYMAAANTGYRPAWTKIAAHPGNFKVTPSTRQRAAGNGADWLGHTGWSNISEADRLTTVAVAIDSINADYFLAGYVDTLGLFGTGLGAYGQEDQGAAVYWGQACLRNLNTLGLTKIYHSSYNADDMWPRDPKFIYPSSGMFYMGTDRMYMYGLNNEDMYSGTTPGVNEMSFTENSIIWYTIGGRGRGAGTFIDANNCKHLQYAPGFLLDGTNGFENDTAYPDGTVSVNTWAIRTIGRQIAFYNHIAAAYTETGIVPFRSCFISDAKYGRRTGTALPNGHVRVKS